MFVRVIKNILEGISEGLCVGSVSVRGEIHAFVRSAFFCAQGVQKSIVFTKFIGVFVPQTP